MENNNNNELYHYGVRGMKRGIRKASKTLSSDKATSEKKEKAVASLEKHKAKATKKVAKLEKERTKLQGDYDRNVTKRDTKARSLKIQAARTRRKAYGRFTSEKKAGHYLFKADKLDAQAEELLARSENTKAKIASNEKYQELFKKGIKDIDATLAKKGRKAING